MSSTSWMVKLSMSNVRNLKLLMPEAMVAWEAVEGMVVEDMADIKVAMVSCTLLTLFGFDGCMAPHRLGH